MFEDFLTKVGAVDMHIYLGSGDLLVTQHGLDGAQVGTALEEVGGKAVAEGMRTDILLDSRLLSIILYIYKEGDAAELGAALGADEDIVLVAGLGLDRHPDNEPLAEFCHSLFANGDKALLASLAMNADIALLEEELAHLKVTELADTQAAAVEHLDDGIIAHALRLALVDSLLDGIYLWNAQHLGQVLAYLRVLEQLGGIGLYLLLQDQEAIEGAHTAEDAGHTARLDTQVLKGSREMVQLFERDMAEVDAKVGIVVQELLQVAHIGIQGVARVGALETEILHITPQNLR